MSLQQKIDRITDILRRDDGISGSSSPLEQGVKLPSSQ